jgi:hypothetical protein
MNTFSVLGRFTSLVNDFLLDPLAVVPQRAVLEQLDRRV